MLEGDYFKFYGLHKNENYKPFLHSPIMKFPITRESLQEFDLDKEKEELREEEIQKGITRILEHICTQIKQTMHSNSKEKKFVWRQINSIRQFNIPGFNSKMDEYLPRFIEKLKETFIGCDIIIDPLKTYLIIDWS